jgi:hypothetical protein
MSGRDPTEEGGTYPIYGFEKPDRWAGKNIFG